MCFISRILAKEKEEALRQQWEEAEEGKRFAVEEACRALQTTLQEEWATEKEQAVETALAAAQVGCLQCSPAVYYLHSVPHLQCTTSTQYLTYSVLLPLSTSPTVY